MFVPGQRLAGRYELIQEIGAGGMATVWRGRDRRLGRPVAIKLLRPELGRDEELARRFEVEARHAASVSHPNVATVFDTDVEDDQRFIVMELVDGPTVEEIIATHGPIEPRIAVEMVAAAARALAAAHRRGLIHRDVKPANLLVGRDGRVRLADFGIARALTASRVTAPGRVLGSVPYISPEQATGAEATAAGDIFSLGVVLFEMLTGELPWTADTPAAMATVRLHVPAPRPSRILHSLPEGLDAIVGRALEIDADRRYPSARVFADALQAWNRRNRPKGAGSLVSATTALVAQIAPHEERRVPLPRLAAASFAVSGAASVNPWARLPAGRGGTRLRSPRPVAPAPRGTRASPSPLGAPAVARDGRRHATGAGVPVAIETDDRPAGRRAGLLLAVLAALLMLGVAGMFLLGGGAAAPTIRPGAGAAASPAPTPRASAPVAPPPSPAPAPTVTPLPIQTSTPTATPTPTPTPTRRSTPAPTSAPVTRSAAATAVVTFYDAVEAHDWDRAIALWSPSMQQRYPPQEWLIDRFRRTTRIDITRLQTVSFSMTTGRARVEVTLVEYRTVEPSPRTFVGAWDLVLIDGRWILDDPDF